MMRNLVGLGRDALAAEMAEFGAEPFRARQLWHWIYHRGAADFAQMTSLSRAFRERLAGQYELRRPAVGQSLVSADGTRKWLVRFADGQEVETVHIPEEDRGTLCVSAQVGCTLNCTFCHTGTQRLVRNLDAAEIVGQVMVARDALGEWPSPQEDRQLTNIVLMGMGEPLYNYENVAAAVKIILDPEGLSISRRKITLSTAGVVPVIARCGAELGVNLAVSLHAVRDDVRDRLVPLNRKYPIAELLDACRTYPGASNARRITFEYVMLKGVNDSPAEARELVRLIAGIPAKVNLIPFNPWPGAPYECSTEAAIAAFSDIVFAAGYSAPVRTPRGRDILAACGQLKSASVQARRSERATGRRCPPPDRSRHRPCFIRCSERRSPPMARFAAGLFLGQRQLLYRPDRSRPDLGELTALGVREVALTTSDGLSLLSWYLPPRPGRPVIVYFHGNGGHIGYRAGRLRRFAGEGYGVFMAEYRGYAGNPGTPCEAGLFADGEAALDFLDDARIDPGRLVLWGESLGSGVAVALAARRQIGGLVLEAPFTSVAAAAQHALPLYSGRADGARQIRLAVPDRPGRGAAPGIARRARQDRSGANGPRAARCRDVAEGRLVRARSRSRGPSPIRCARRRDRLYRAPGWPCTADGGCRSRQFGLVRHRH